MIVHSFSFNPNIAHLWASNRRTPHAEFTISNVGTQSNESFGERLGQGSVCSNNLCSCGRRRLIQAIGSSLFPISTSTASDLLSNNASAMMDRVHPPRPDWYEELYASAMDTTMKSYEAEIADYKSQLFGSLKGEASEVLEIGIGTGPNLKYYGCNNSIRVFGIDPNRSMEKYARAAAVAAGLPPANFEFVQAVAEALPLADASVDSVVGTLVLCSVKHVDMTLKEVRRVLKPGGCFLFLEHVAAKDGTILRYVQSVLDPLQQLVADGCHLTRTTGYNISEAGFSHVEINMAFVRNASLISPHVYGIARK